MRSLQHQATRNHTPNVRHEIVVGTSRCLPLAGSHIFMKLMATTVITREGTTGFECGRGVWFSPDSRRAKEWSKDLFTADGTVHGNFAKGEVPVAGLEATDSPQARSTLAHPRGTRSCAEVFFQCERVGKSIVVKARKGRASKRNPSGMLVAIFEEKRHINNFAFGREKASVVSCVTKNRFSNFATCRFTCKTLRCRDQKSNTSAAPPDKDTAHHICFYLYLGRGIRDIVDTTCFACAADTTDNHGQHFPLQRHNNIRRKLDVRAPCSNLFSQPLISTTSSPSPHNCDTSSEKMCASVVDLIGGFSSCCYSARHVGA